MACSSWSWVSNQALVTPAKTPTSSSSSTTLVILRNACLILHPSPHPSLPLSSLILSPQPISVKPFLSPLRAQPPQKYVYPHPIPQFAEAETQKFKSELFNKFSKDKETFGDDLDAVIEVCGEVFNNFLHNEYGGPGTLLVDPFTNMFVVLKEKKLPGAPVWLHGHPCYGLKTMSIMTGRFGTQTHTSDFLIIIQFITFFHIIITLYCCN